MEDLMQKWVAGGGIEYHYMTSKDKCKPEYKGLWANAVNKQMVYLGFISNNQRDALLQKVTALIDPSWDIHYSSFGGHFNRTIVEAMMQGAIPIARNYGMSGKKSGKNLLFTPDVNYIMIPHDATPKQFGSIVNKAIYSRSIYKEITTNNAKMLKLFDRKAIADEVIKLTNHISKSKLQCLTAGRSDFEVAAKSTKTLESFFGIKQKKGGWLK